MQADGRHKRLDCDSDVHIRRGDVRHGRGDGRLASGSTTRSILDRVERFDRSGTASASGTD